MSTNFGNALSAAGTGAATGATIGSAIPGIGTGIGAGIGGIIGGAGSIASGFLSGDPKETKTQTAQRELLDQYLQSVKGEGPFSDLFNSSEESFQKHYVDPAKSRFKNQIAPSIQQQYIADGQQRGSSMEDALTRAGVDLDQMLNEQYGQFQNRGQQNQMSAINQILGASPGVQDPLNFQDKLKQSTAGYLNSDSFSQTLKDLFGKQPQQQGVSPQSKPPLNPKSKELPKGFIS